VSVHVLVVSDGTMSSAETREVLSRAGYQVTATRQVARAEDLVHELRPDLVMVEPGDDAPAVLAAVRRIREARLAPCLFVLGGVNPDLLERAISAGAMAVLAPPLTEIAVTAAVEVARARWTELRESWHETAAAREALESRALVDRAKLALIARENLCEPEAHHLIQQLSMTSRRRKRAVAEAILFALGVDPAQHCTGAYAPSVHR